MNLNELSDALICWLKDSVYETGAKGAVFGLSGGVDSAVVGVLCKKAFDQNALGIVMPCYSNINDKKDADFLADKFDIKHKTIVLDGVYDEFLKVVDKSDNNLVKANIKPRLRMTALYYYAGINNYLVVGSENKSELTVGYFTKYGDGGADLWPIGNLVKNQVKSLALHLKIPQTIIDKVPTAGLWQDQTDENEMGITYNQLDRFILTGETENKQVKEKIITLNKNSQHKRKTPCIPNFTLDL